MAAAVPFLLILILLPSLPASADLDPPSSTGPEMDTSALLRLKAGFINTTALSSWSTGRNPCDNARPWAGVFCFKGRVAALSLVSMSLSGTVDVGALKDLTSLRTISLADNAFSGSIPELHGLQGLKALYLSGNKFSGEIPDNFFEKMVGLQKLWLGNNSFAGSIPGSIADLSSLVELRLENNKFTGNIPRITVTLQAFSVANNAVTGRVSPALLPFYPAGFVGTNGVCGLPPMPPCPIIHYPVYRPPTYSQATRTALLVLVVSLLVVFAGMVLRRQRVMGFAVLGKHNSRSDDGAGSRVSYQSRGMAGSGRSQAQQRHQEPGNNGWTASSAGDAGGGGGVSGTGGLGGATELVMVNDEKGVFGLPDLMKAAAEVLGSGGLGSAYKAVMTNGAEVVVKRLHGMNRADRETFAANVRLLGRLRHRNVLPPLAYNYRKEEKLLIYEFVPKGNLLYVLHGDRGADHAALNWPTRLKILRGIARGVAYLHSELAPFDVPHGNLKSANILLDTDFEPLLIDYGFVPLVNPSHSAAALFAYFCPEALQHRDVSPKSDVYCLGIVILELLTGKFPSQYMNNTKGGTDVVRWAHSAVGEGRDLAELLDPAISVDKSSVPVMEQLLRIGAACAEPDPDRRPSMSEVAEWIEDVAAEAERAAAIGTAPSLKDGYPDASGNKRHAAYVSDAVGESSAGRLGSFGERSARRSEENFAFAIS